MRIPSFGLLGTEISWHRGLIDPQDFLFFTSYFFSTVTRKNVAGMDVPSCFLF